MAIKPEDRDAVKSYTRDLQQAVGEYFRSAEDLRAACTQARQRLQRTRGESESASFKWSVRSDVLEEMGIRTTRPTPTQVTLELPEGTSEKADRVEVFETSKTMDGTAGTRLIGVAKYPDNNGRWRVEYIAGPFGSRENGHLTLHAEVLGSDGALLAVDCAGLVD